MLDTLSDKNKQVLNLFRAAAVVTDRLFWQQTFGDKALMENLGDQAAADYAMINYGPWDRLDDNSPFVKDTERSLPGRITIRRISPRPSSTLLTTLPRTALILSSGVTGTGI